VPVVSIIIAGNCVGRCTAYVRELGLEEVVMTRFFSVAMGLIAMLGQTGFANADDKKTDEFPKLIVAKWEITKAGGSAPAGTVLDFAKDKSVTMIIKMDDNEIKTKGSYTIEKDKVTLKFKFGGMDSEEVLTIKKLTDEAMELEDKDGGVDVLKKKK
jgi:uncharacterized protein (TIGR03066 family)